ncbi:spore germination gerac [Lucifera butyrica]|uniref:Spore germination gerac n=1 Tax=Lucifera butyrica TaxID=1351585 RepID=A0A498R1D2_9FIRM|nr:Ger(x)C family spore germination protein [Lucifera butyrica]VBB06396.1 spore germination gerac [Lucifera butyrica]
MTRRRVCAMLLLAYCLLLTGCWDRRELQDRNFVLAIGIDTAAAEPAKRAAVETYKQLEGSKKYSLDLQVLKLVTPEEPGKQSKTFVISNVGNSFFQMERDLFGQSSKPLYFEHVQTIILSEAVVRDAPLTSLLSFFRKDSEMRWRIKVYVTSGKARPLLEFVPPNHEAGGIYLANIAKLYRKNLHVAGERTDLGYISLALDNHNDVAIPRIELAGNVVKVGGLAVFHKDRFAGFLDEQAVAGLKLIRGLEKEAVISISCPERPDRKLVFKLLRHDTRLASHVDGGRLYFTLDINMVGNINEMQGCSEYDPRDSRSLRNLEVAFADKVKTMVLYGLQQMEDLKVDVAGLNDKLREEQPELWQQVKDGWDQRLPQIPLAVSVNVTIRNYGEHTK